MPKIVRDVVRDAITARDVVSDAAVAHERAGKLLDDILHDVAPEMKPPPFTGWQALANLALTVRCGDRTLLVALQHYLGTTDWQLIALETVVEGGIESVFSDHAHKNLGRVKGMIEAIAAAEKYAALWLAQREAREEELRCDCGPIRKASARRLIRKKVPAGRPIRASSKLASPQVVVKGKQKNG